jgi:radical SAM protein with 4Fe4S-binding SPASM domain
MANILFTTYCNRNCPYCFAKGKVDLGKDKGDPSKNISPAALEKIIAFYKKSMLRRFVILGGEPTLHPSFTPLLQRVLAEPDFKSVLVFTNGLIPPGVEDDLAAIEDKRLRLAMNLNAPDAYPVEQQTRIAQTLSRLGPKIGLGINIYRSGQDYDYLIEAIQAHGLVRHVRVGLTHPIGGSVNRFARREAFPEIARDILAFAQKAYQHEISFSFDCGFEFCMFSLDQHQALLRCGIKFLSRCDPIIDIGPDLSVWRCFPLLKDVCGTLDDFEHRNRIIDHYEDKYKTIMRMGNLAQCPKCRYRINGLCSGGCLARVLNSFQGSAKVSSQNG